MKLTMIESSAGSFFCNNLAFRTLRAGVPSVYMHVGRDEGKLHPTAADKSAVVATVVTNIRRAVLALAVVLKQP